MKSDNPGLHSRYVMISESRTGIALTFEPSVALTLGSPRREKEALWRVMSKMRRAKPFELAIVGTQVQATFDPAVRGRLFGVLAAIGAYLDAFQTERLHPRVVEEILGISSRERLRWTKDGRLPKSGAGTFRSGPQIMHFPLYRAQKIAALAKNGEIIRAWREADAVRIARDCETSMPSSTSQTGSRQRALDIELG